MSTLQTGSLIWPDEPKPLSNRAVLFGGAVIGFWLGVLVSALLFG